MTDRIEQITSPAVAEPSPNIFSNCLRVGDQVFMSGMTASGASDGGAYEQSKACLEKIKALVEAAGGSMSDIVKITIYLTDMSYRPDFGRARGEYFSGRMPCSTLVEVGALAQPGLVVEVDATAIIGAGS